MCRSSSLLSYENIPKRFLHSGQNILTSSMPVLLFFTRRILRCSENPLHPLQKPVYSGSNLYRLLKLPLSHFPDPIAPAIVQSNNSQHGIYHQLNGSFPKAISTIDKIPHITPAPNAINKMNIPILLNPLRISSKSPSHSIQSPRLKCQNKKEPGLFHFYPIPFSRGQFVKYPVVRNLYPLNGTNFSIVLAIFSAVGYSLANAIKNINAVAVPPITIASFRLIT